MKVAVNIMQVQKSNQQKYYLINKNTTFFNSDGIKLKTAVKLVHLVSSKTNPVNSVLIKGRLFQLIHGPSDKPWITILIQFSQ